MGVEGSRVLNLADKKSNSSYWPILLNAFGEIGPKIQAAGNHDGWTLRNNWCPIYGVAWSWYCVSTCKNLLNRSKVGPAVKQTAQPATHKADKPTSRKSTPTLSRPITNHCRAKKLRKETQWATREWNCAGKWLTSPRSRCGCSSRTRWVRGAVKNVLADFVRLGGTKNSEKWVKKG